jgi:hypothetical protein
MFQSSLATCHEQNNGYCSSFDGNVTGKKTYSITGLFYNSPALARLLKNKGTNPVGTLNINKQKAYAHGNQRYQTKTEKLMPSNLGQ